MFAQRVNSKSSRQGETAARRIDSLGTENDTPTKHVKTLKKLRYQKGQGEKRDNGGGS